MESPLALYRRYRPETFAEVIGQDHVTEPLRAALANNRVNHAYLFSGPRGCGKTTSARILARALNCEQAPIADPCGECRSCVDLARGGPGSIDVIEIDAASHGGVDDARDLREKAFFAPVHSRYKVYVIDEAHMVTTQGFNALLKLVEEPPPHLRFIFATTEPEKVLPTIRSRTHHYPFRLIPPRLLSSYLHELCEKEAVPIEAAAVPLVVRAGGGSARDTLSVLDQLIGGAGPEGVTHALATGLLGYTPDSLLDEVVDAFAAGDGGGVFGVVDKVIETGQDPRRFTEDLLRRIRDLVIVAAVPDAPATGLIDVPVDAGERLVAQAARFGGVELSRAADLVAAGLTEMRGATAPRLLLELICARVLLPGADSTSDGVMARLERLERRMAMPGGLTVASDVVVTPTPMRPAATRPAEPVAEPARPAPSPVEPPRSTPTAEVPAAPPAVERPAPPAEPAPQERALQAPPVEAPPTATETGPADDASGWPTPARLPGASGDAAAPERPAESPTERLADRPAEPAAPYEAPAPQPSAAAEPPAQAPAETTASSMSLADVRRLWPDVVERTKAMRRVTWIHLAQNSQVVAFNGGVLSLGFSNAGARQSFESGGSLEIVRQAAIDVLGVDWRIEAIVDPGSVGGTTASGAGGGRPQQARPEPAGPESARPAQQSQAPAPAAPAEGGRAVDPSSRRTDVRPPAAEPAAERPQSTRPRPPYDEAPPPAEPPSWVDDDDPDPDAAVSPDDPEDENPELAGTELLQRELGATVIEQIKHD